MEILYEYSRQLKKVSVEVKLGISIKADFNEAVDAIEKVAFLSL